jgi:hypothetical protein
MAAPSDAHIVRELGRVLGARVLATIARPSHIEGRVRALHPDSAPEPPPPDTSEPPVLELTRRRTTTARGFDAGFRAPDGTKEAKLGPRLALPDDEPAMPLVRHKPSLTPPAGSKPPEASSAAVPRAAAAKPDKGEKTGKAISRTFARPSTGGAWQRGERTERRSNTQPLIPALPPAESSPAIVVTSPKQSGPTTPLEGALSDLAERRSIPAPAPAPAAISSAPPPPPISSAPPPPPVDTTPPSPDERWDLPSQPPAAPAGKAPANKLSSRATADLPTIKAAPTDIGAILAAMRNATQRDDVVKLACEGATSVARASVFFALRKGVLKGWDGAGPGVRRDSVRNLWIPTSSASTFKKVLDTRSGTVGPYGTSVADGLFRAAVGSRGGDFMVQPVIVGGKVVGMLCVDDLRPGPLGAHRIEVLTQTVGDAFLRIISAGKD